MPLVKHRLFCVGGQRLPHAEEDCASWSGHIQSVTHFAGQSNARLHTLYYISCQASEHNSLAPIQVEKIGS